MLNHQIKTQNIVYFATFLPINRQLSSCGHKKRDLPKRTDPFTYYIRVILTLQQLPARRLTDADYQYITEIWETFGKHYEHELHILHPIFSISNILFILCR